MGPNKIVSFVLLVVGVILLIVGVNASHSIADQATNTFAGHFTQSTTWYIIGGIGLALLGGLMLFMGPRGKGA